MTEHIIVQNFGPLKDIDIETKPFTILIGESASGKSTLMKITSMMRYLFKMANIRSYLKHSKITNSPFRIRFDYMLKKTGLQSMLKSNTVIRYSFSSNNGVQYEISVENKKLSKLPLIQKEDLMFSKISFISENRNIIPTWSENASSNAGATLGFYFHETLNDFVRLSANEQTMPLTYIDHKLYISHPKGKPTQYKLEKTDDKSDSFELREASSGMQTSIPIALIVKNLSANFSFKEAFRRSVLNYLTEIDNLTKFNAVKEQTELPNYIYIHIEEPELSLFPDAQCKLTDELIYSATHTDNRKVNLMFATHSPYILNYLNVVLCQKDDTRARLTSNDMAVYRIYNGTNQSLLVQDETGRFIVDTYDLSEMMNNIYQEYTNLNS